MHFFADLHIHSRYSRATSRDCDLEHLSGWARRKGIAVLGTGDFTHPAWFAEICSKLTPAEPGLFRLQPEIEADIARMPAVSPAPPTRFVLQVEISTIYKKDDRTRKVHHIVYVPTIEAAHRFRQQLDRIGNINSDGRPILGLDSRDLLEIVLESDPGSFLVPAHIWTPWFAVLGSKSGFDTIDQCYGDLADHIFAAETGLSSDPPMNWRLSALDRYRLVSNSDAHSPSKLGREACVFDTALDYFAMREALATGIGYGGTIEFFPEEGKYHLDGHRKCGVVLTPEETRERNGICPECGKPLTVGVMHRITMLADRPAGTKPESAADFRSLVPLNEVIGEILQVGPQSKRVQHTYDQLIARLGPELSILDAIPLEDIKRHASPILAEGIDRLRHGRVIRQAGFDGVFGSIRLFAGGELTQRTASGQLFDLPRKRRPAPQKASATRSGAEPPVTQKRSDNPSTRTIIPPTPDANPTLSSATASRLDSAQRTAATAPQGPILIVAGPGTGKTHTLVHRIAHVIDQFQASPTQCLAITFTRRAARELNERLRGRLPKHGGDVLVTTFHGLGLSILREQPSTAGLRAGFEVLDDDRRAALAAQSTSTPKRRTASLTAEISRLKRSNDPPDPDSHLAQAWHAYHHALQQQNAVDFDDLVRLPNQILDDNGDIQAEYQRRYPWIFVDEFQDVDPLQFRLIQLLAADDGNVCVIGDPDQSIYGFRGADVGLFWQFPRAFPTAQIHTLDRNYRSAQTIVEAATQLIAPSSLVKGRLLSAIDRSCPPIVIHRCPTDRAEAEFVVHTVEQLIGGHSFFSLDSNRVGVAAEEQWSFNDFAVLYRTTAQAELLIEAFERSGMPYQCRQHERLTSLPAIRELIAILRERLGKQLAPPQWQSVLEDARGGITPTATTPRRFARAIDDLIEFLQAKATPNPLPAEALIDHLVLARETDTWDPRADRVTLLTLHAAKGLEFSNVFLVGCEDTILPLRFGSKAAADVDEERRLFFVGMTRARHHLWLTHAERRTWRGRRQEMGVSPFLKDIDQILLEHQHSARKTRSARPGDAQLDLFVPGQNSAERGSRDGFPKR